MDKEMTHPNVIKLYDLLHKYEFISSKSQFKRLSCQTDILLNNKPVDMLDHHTTFVRYSAIITIAKIEYCYTPIGLITSTETVPKPEQKHAVASNFDLVYDLLKWNWIVSEHSHFSKLFENGEIKINQTNIKQYFTHIRIEDIITFKDIDYSIMTSGGLIEQFKETQKYDVTAIAQITNILFDLFINNELVDTPSQLIELLKQSKVNNIPMKFYNTPVTVNDTITINDNKFTLKYKLVDKKPKDAKVTCVPPNEVLIEQNVGKIKK